MYFWLESIELAKERVKVKVKEGGHNIDSEVIERRYIRGVKNLFDIYMSEADGLLVIDNSTLEPKLVAKKNEGNNLAIINKTKFYQLKSFYEKHK